MTTPTSPKSSLRSLERTSDVSMSEPVQPVERLGEQGPAGHGDGQAHGIGRLRRGQRLVEVVDAQREADGGQRAAEAPEQVVVAAAAAERRAEPGVVHLEHRARVVAEVAREAEIDDEPPRDLGREPLVEAQQAVGRVADRVAELLEHLGAAAQARDAQQQARVRVVDAQHAELALHPHEVAAWPARASRARARGRRRRPGRAAAGTAPRRRGRCGTRAARSPRAPGTAR